MLREPTAPYSENDRSSSRHVFIFSFSLTGKTFAARFFGGVPFFLAGKTFGGFAFVRCVPFLFHSVPPCSTCFTLFHVFHMFHCVPHVSRVSLCSTCFTCSRARWNGT